MSVVHLTKCGKSEADVLESNSPPKKAMTDDVTGEPLIQRSDDTADTLRKRLVTYHQQTDPVAEYYKTKGVSSRFVSHLRRAQELISRFEQIWTGIDAAQSPKVVWSSLLKCFKEQ